MESYVSFFSEYWLWVLGGWFVLILMRRFRFLATILTLIAFELWGCFTCSLYCSSIATFMAALGSIIILLLVLCAIASIFFGVGLVEGIGDIIGELFDSGDGYEE